MVKYLSGRVKRTPQDQLKDDRYQYLNLEQAEPNLSDPLIGPSPPPGGQYQLIAIPGYPGQRFWVPVGGGLIPGAITIFDEGVQVSAASSITQLNFVGAAVTANVSVQSPSGHPGIAATVTVIPVSVGETPPNYPTPNEGELWWESDTGDLYIYYNDGDSAQWVMTNAGGRGLTGDKGQKGEVGTDANLPVATIVAYGGSSAPSGWQICNGGSSSTSALQAIVGSNVPDLRNRFIVGAGSGGNYSPNDTGGSADAVLVSHTHNLQNHVHGVSLTSSTNTHNHGISDPGHFHTTNDYVARSNYAEPRNFGVGTDGNLNSTGNTNSKTTGITINNDSHSHTVSGNTGTPSSNTTDTLGESATNKNLPPYYALIYIIKT